jgi:alanyl aminopeptidase
MRAHVWIAIAVACGPTPPARPPVVVTPKPAPDAAVDPGFAPPQPTLRLPRHFTPVRYTARVALDPAFPDFNGEIAIEGTLDQRASVIWLHGKQLAVTAATATRDDLTLPLAVTPHGDLLEVRSARPLDAGPWTLTMTYGGRIDASGFTGAFLTKLGADPYVVTQFESTGARLVFPCIDEPDRKAPWQLMLDIPKDQVAVSNTPSIAETPLDGGRVRVTFAPTRPLPSYLVAFAVGPFEVVDAGLAHSGLALRVLTPRGTAKKVTFLAGSLARIVDILETWFQIPFPYPKLDIVVVPSLRGGAMENAGMITTDARNVMYDKPTARDRYGIVSLIGHETAHQWFGDLVTAAWWDDIWLNESFATWIEDKILVAFDPTWPSESPAHRGVAFGSDELASARRIRQPITSESDIHNAFDAITYPKGASVLRMIEHHVGEAKFRDAIHAYLLAHLDRNATAADVFEKLDATGAAKLGGIETSFFDQAGFPAVTMAVRCDAGKASIALAQQRWTATDDDKLPEQSWVVPVCVAYDDGKHGRAESCTVLDRATTELSVDHCPAWFAPGGDYGYYRAVLDVTALEHARDLGWALLTPAERVSMSSDIYASVRAGRLPFALAMSFATKLRTGTPAEVATALGDWGALGFGGSGLPGSYEQWIPDDLRPGFEARVRTWVEPMAQRLGIVATRDEDVLTEAVHADVLSSVRWSHSHVLDAEAKRLATHYRDVPRAARWIALTIAANADAKLAEHLRGEAVDEHDPELRDMLFNVVAGLDDPAQHRAMLDALVADPRVLAEDIINIMNAGDRRARLDSADYVRGNLDALLKRLPPNDNEDFPLALNLAYVVAEGCDAARRDADVEFLTKHFATLPSAERPVKQIIENLDHCIARKKLLEPSLRAWVKTR